MTNLRAIRGSGLCLVVTLMAWAQLNGCSVSKTSTRTVLLIEADSEVQRGLENIRIRVQSAPSGTQRLNTVLQPPTSQHGWPMQAMIAREPDEADRNIEIEIEARLEGRMPIWRLIHTEFVAGNEKYLTLRLDKPCLGAGDAGPSEVSWLADKLSDSKSDSHVRPIAACSSQSDPNNDAGLEESDASALCHTVTKLGDASQGNVAEPDPTDRPQLVVDGEGNVTVVWKQSAATTAPFQLWSQRFDVARGWSEAQALSSTDGEDAKEPSLALSDNGDVSAAWRQCKADAAAPSKSTCQVFANRYTIGSGWSDTAQLSTSAEPAGSVRLAVHADGHSVALWSQGTQFWSARSESAEGWSQLQPIDHGSDASSPELAVRPDGSAIAVWAEGADEDRKLWFSLLENGTWSMPAPLPAPTHPPDKIKIGLTGGPRIAVAANGDVFATGIYYYGWHHIWLNRFIARDAKWTAASNITSELGGDSSPPRMAADSNGRVHLLWLTKKSVYSMLADANPNPPPIEQLPGDADFIRLAINSEGRALAVWQQTTNMTAHLNGNAFYDPSWRGPQQLDDIESETVTDSDLAIDGSGNGLAVWTQLGGLWQSHFSEESAQWEAPRQFTTMRARQTDSKPRVILDQAGRATLLWLRSDEHGKQLWACRSVQ